MTADPIHVIIFTIGFSLGAAALLAVLLVRVPNTRKGR